MEALVFPAPTLAHALAYGVLPSRLDASMLEAAIARLLAEGAEIPEIAEKLGYTQEAIAEAVRALLVRTRCRNTTALIARLLRSGRMQ